MRSAEELAHILGALAPREGRRRADCDKMPPKGVSPQLGGRAAGQTRVPGMSMKQLGRPRSLAAPGTKGRHLAGLGGRRASEPWKAATDVVRGAEGSCRAYLHAPGGPPGSEQAGGSGLREGLRSHRGNEPLDLDSTFHVQAVNMLGATDFLSSEAQTQCK